MENINVLGMISQDFSCIFDILKVFVDNIKRGSKKAEYGQDDGRNTFFTTSFLQDISVFVYEMIKIIPDIKTAVEPELVGDDFFGDLKKVRNAIHIREKGSFENRAKSIIENIESCFENSHYDVSLLYRITKPNATFLSSNVYYYHMTGKIGDIMAGAAIKNYSQNLSMIIKCVSQMFTKLNYIIPTVNCPQFATMQIETFDYTIESLSKRTGLSKTSDVRFMLMHSYVSFINMFFELINADKLIELDDCWLFFLAKLYSIRYTEIMDSFDSFDAHITGEEKAVITDLLEFKGFDRKEVLRNFAKKLRDLIHYELLPNFPPIFKSGEYYVDIEQVYLNSVGLQSIYEFKELFYALRFDMKMMQLRFGRLFNLDSRVEDLPLKLARGGKTLVAR